MKKFAKMSLVAAVAVAGFTSANAGSLEEAIKNVEISGNVTYEYKDASVTDGTKESTSQINEYDLELTLKSKINDTVTAVVKFDVANDTDAASADANTSVNVEDVYFSYAPAYGTFTLGKQNIPGPWTDGKQGTGLVAMVPAGPVTIAAAYFNNTSLSNASDAVAIGDVSVSSVSGISTPAIAATGAVANTAGQADLAAIAVLASVGPVNVEAWYGDLDEIAKTYVLSASADIGPVAVSASHSYVKADAAGSDKGTLTKLEVSGSVDVVNLTASYGFTNDENTQGVLADGSDADAGYGSELFDITDTANADMFMIGANMNVTDSINLGLDYAAGEYDSAVNSTTEIEVSEIMFTAKYAMSSNFNVRFFYAMGEAEITGNTTDVETDKGAVEFKYTF